MTIVNTVFKTDLKERSLLPVIQITIPFLPTESQAKVDGNQMAFETKTFWCLWFNWHSN
jgi:hypothetical protein